MYEYEFPRPAVSADVAVFRGEAGDREVLLVKRGADPFIGCWALPGGFVEEGETLETAALRELEEETGLAPARDLAQVGAYGDPGRDPRGWTVTVLYCVALAFDEPSRPTAGDDAAEAAWFDVSELPALAFDHDILVADAYRHTAFGQ